jgi:hypothetical protein
MSVEGPTPNLDLYNRSKEFANSITAGDVVVKHTNDESGSKEDIPF